MANVSAAGGYVESRLRKKRTKRRTSSRSSSTTKTLPLQERSDIAQHRKRADHNSIATACFLGEEQASASSGSQDWQSHRPLKDAMAVISRNRITQQVGKVGIYNQAKSSQPAQRDIHGNGVSQQGSQGKITIVPLCDEVASTSRPITLTKANLTLFTQLQENRNPKISPHGLPCHVATPCGGELASKQFCQESGSRGSRRKLVKASQKEISDICKRLASSVKPEHDFNISYRKQLETELRKLVLECDGLKWSPLCSSTPAILTSSTVSTGIALPVSSAKEKTLFAATTSETAMTIDTTPSASTTVKSLAADLTFPNSMHSNASPLNASPSKAVQQVVDEQYPINVKPLHTAYCGTSPSLANETNPLAMFADVVTTQERAVVDDMEVASADHTTIAGAPIPHSQSLPQSTFSLAASSSSHQAGRNTSEQPFFPATTDAPGGHSWMYPDQATGADLPQLLMSTAPIPSQARMTHGQWCTLPSQAKGSHGNRQDTLMDCSTMTSSMGTTTVTAADISHRHSVMELLPPQLHRMPLRLHQHQAPCTTQYQHTRHGYGHGRTHPAFQIPGTHGVLYNVHSEPAPYNLHRCSTVPDLLDSLDHEQLLATGGDDMIWNDTVVQSHLAAGLAPLSKPNLNSPSSPDFKLFPQKMY